MTNSLEAAARRRRRIAVVVDKLAAPGEFIHVDGRTPRLASGEHVPRATLKALEIEGAVEVIVRGLFGDRPMQYAAPRADRQCPAPALRGGHAWTPERRRAALDLWLAGETKVDVARHFHTSRGFIVRMARVDKWPTAR